MQTTSHERLDLPDTFLSRFLADHIHRFFDRTQDVHVGLEGGGAVGVHVGGELFPRCCEFALRRQSLEVFRVDRVRSQIFARYGWCRGRWRWTGSKRDDGLRRDQSREARNLQILLERISRGRACSPPLEEPEAKVVLVQKMTCLNGCDCCLLAEFDPSGGERELVRAPRRERPDRPEVQLKIKTRSADSWLLAAGVADVNSCWAESLAPTRGKRAHLASASSANHSPQHFRLSTVCAPSRYHLIRASFGSGESWHRPGHRVRSSAATYGSGSGFGATKSVGRAGSEFGSADSNEPLVEVLSLVAEDAAQKADGHRSEARKDRTRATAREALDRWWTPARPAGTREVSVIDLRPKDSFVYTAHRA